MEIQRCGRFAKKPKKSGHTTFIDAFIHAY